MPTLGVEAAIVDNGRILLVKDRMLPAWRLPGSKLAAGDTPIAALVRTVAQQTGLQVRVGRLIGLYSRPRWRQGGDMAALFLALTVGGRRRAMEESPAMGYFPPKALPQNLFPWYRQRIADALAGQQRAIVRNQDVAWPFATEESDKVLETLMEDGFTSPEEALREASRRLNLIIPDGEIMRMLGA